MCSAIARIVALVPMIAMGALFAAEDGKGQREAEHRGRERHPPISEKEMKQAYETLPPWVRTRLDRAEPEVRRRFLRPVVERQRRRKVKEKVQANFEAAQAKAAQRTEVAELYDVDPLLEKAWRCYLNRTERGRDACIRLFQDFMDKHPNSVFVPEIYFRIGTLYSTHRNREAGETYERDLARQYFEKAHKMFGEKYCGLNECAWMTLANYSKNLAFMKRCYDWMRRMLHEGTLEDIYPYREIGQCLNGRPPELDETARQVRYRSMKENLPAGIRTMEKNIFHRFAGDRAALADLARSYPKTELGRQSRMRLTRLGPDLSGRLINELLEAGETPQPRATPPPKTPPQAPPGKSTRRGTADAGARNAPVAPRSHRSEPPWLSLIAIAGAVVVTAAAVLTFVRRHRNRFPP